MLPLLLSLLATLPPSSGPGPDISVIQDPESVADLTDESLASLQATAVEVAAAVQALLPELEGPIRLQVRTIDRDLDPVGGVAGWATRPGEVQLLVSVTYPGGIPAALRDGLAPTLYHEFHHLWRGWTLEENRFGPGIPTAVVNEGPASVFGESYSGITFERFDYPENVAEWLDEILALPLDADYDAWMNDHPDGRIAVGYRTGRYVIHQAMERSGLDILALGELPPEEVLELAGAGTAETTRDR